MRDYLRIWEEIDRDNLPSGAVVRRVLPDLAHDCHIGAWKPSGERWLELALKGPIGEVPTKDASTQGLEVRVVQESKQSAVIRLTQKSPLMSQQFFDVVEDILDLLEGSPHDGAAARVVERLLAWRAFFAQAHVTMSQDAAAGLFAELTILRDVVAPYCDPVSAVAHWTGPDPARQDFQFNKAAVEVKSWRGTGVASIRITSEDQLDTTAAGRIFLALVQLDQRQAGPGATLGELIDEVRGLVSSSVAAEYDLANKLLTVGWLDELRDSRTDRYTVLGFEFFDVRDSFPRLTPSTLPPGVGRVSYHVDRGALDDYLTSRDEVRKELGLVHG